MVTRFQARIGRERIGKSINQRAASNTRSSRAGMRNVINEYQRFIDHIEATTPQILVEALEPTMKKAKRYAPKDTGTLVNSAYLEIVVKRGKPTVEMGFGRGGNPEYAAVVHENLEYSHKAPTQAKFLQRALEEDELQIKNRLVFLLKEAANT